MAKEGDTRTYAVFEPGQIKSAVANRGTFDQENPDIRFSVDEETEQEYNALTQRGDVVLGDQDETYTEGNTPHPLYLRYCAGGGAGGVQRRIRRREPGIPGGTAAQRPEPDGEPTANPGNEPETEPPPAGRQPDGPERRPPSFGETAR